MGSIATSADHDTFTIHTPELTLAFSLDDGGLRALWRSGGPNVLGYGVACPSIDVSLAGHGWLAERTFVRYLSHSAEARDGAVELVVVIGVGPLIVHDRYRITGTLIARRVSIQNVGEDEVQLQGVRLSLPWARVGALETCHFDAPGNSVRPHVPLAVAAAQRRDVLPRRFFAPGLRAGSAIERAPTHGLGLLALHDTSSDEALLCWYYTTADACQPQVHGNDLALTLSHEVSVADWLRSEVALTTGTQYIMLLRETWPATLGALRRTWPICGLRVLDQPAQWVRDAAIYEVHASHWGDLRGLAAALQYLRDLGLNTLCLLPVWSFGGQNEQPWDGNWDANGDPYTVRDFDTIDPALGAAEDLRALVDAAHRNEMRVLLDLPLDGCAADSRLVAEYPDWFCYDDDGHLAHLADQPATAVFDWSNTGLHDYMLGWALACARAFDLDGYRAIVPRAMVPNWARARRGHASAGGMAVLELLDRLQRELKWIKPDAVILGDQHAPVYAASQDFAVDHLPHHMFLHLALSRITPAEFGEWLEDAAQALPYDTARVCYTESYRTRLSNPLADGLRGSLISRMMLAGLVLCGFVPLIRAGQEQADGQIIAGVLGARTRHPALRRGRAIFGSLPCSSPQVFGVLRTHESEPLIGLLNVGPHRQTVTLSVPVDRLGLAEADYELYNVFERQAWAEAGRQSWRR
jgi:starch synthase (maltosyl-transferring)